MNFTNPTTLTLAEGQGIGTITDDDALPGLSVNDAIVVEGEAGTVPCHVHTLRLDVSSGREVRR